MANSKQDFQSKWVNKSRQCI